MFAGSMQRPHISFSKGSDCLGDTRGSIHAHKREYLTSAALQLRFEAHLTHQTKDELQAKTTPHGVIILAFVFSMICCCVEPVLRDQYELEIGVLPTLL